MIIDGVEYIAEAAISPLKPTTLAEELDVASTGAIVSLDAVLDMNVSMSLRQAGRIHNRVMRLIRHIDRTMTELG